MPPMASPNSLDESEAFARKRRLDEQYEAAQYKRSRSNASSGHSTTRRQLPNGARQINGLHPGTQHNPPEIASSPEEALRDVLSRWMKNPGQSVLPEDLKDAGLFVQKLDPYAKKRKYHAVAGGRIPGLYTNWSLAMQQIHKYSHSCHKSFNSKDKAWEFMNANRNYVEAALQHQQEIDPSSYESPPAHDTAHQSTPSTPPPPYTSHAHAPPAPSSEQCAQSTQESTSSTKESTPSPTARQHPANLPPAPTQAFNYMPEVEPTLSAEQQNVVDRVMGGMNVFYTGSAGCGKSTILKAIVRKLSEKEKRVQIIAPTNLAALNVGGQTIWSFAGWTPDSMKYPLDKLKAAACGKDSWKKFNKVDVLIIDEISMIENVMFERLNQVMKSARGLDRGPFGGVQVIVTGDVWQLQSFPIEVLTSAAVLPAFASEAVLSLPWLWLVPQA